MKTRCAFLLVFGLVALAESSYASFTFTTLEPPGSYSSYARGISGDTVVGVYSDGFEDFVYLYDGSTYADVEIETGIPESPFAMPLPNGVFGNTIVGTDFADFVNGATGFIYDGRTFTRLRFPGATATYAEGIAGGTVVGSYRDDDDATHGFIYDGSTFTTLDVPGASYTELLGISGGTIVGHYVDRATRMGHGFIYDGSTFATLDFPGAVNTEARGVSGGTVVGTYVGADNSLNSFVYDGSSYTTLNVPPSMGEVTFALDISGNTVVGWYSTLDDFGTIFEDRTHGFSVVIPEPGGATLLAIGGLGLLARRRSIAKKSSGAGGSRQIGPCVSVNDC